jgi:hypothetical protein
MFEHLFYSFLKTSSYIYYDLIYLLNQSRNKYNQDTILQQLRFLFSSKLGKVRNETTSVKKIRTIKKEKTNDDKKSNKKRKDNKTLS